MSTTLSNIKRFLIGAPFPTSREMHERLDKVRALAVFASDPISSNAYATEAIMSVLIVLGSSALALTLPLALGVAGLVLIVVLSYIQTILHYPDGGGAYTVAKDNLGRFPSLLAGGALLTDYILTVSVSSSAGVRAVTSAFPQVWPYRVWLALFAILFITWMNLRGIRESGTVFAFPTFAFVGGVWVVLAIGLVRTFGLFGVTPLEPLAASVPAGIRFDIIDYDYRDILDPLVDYIDKVNNEEYADQLVTVVVPAFVPKSFWARLLHNQTARILRARLHNQKDLIVIDVPYHIEPPVVEEGRKERTWWSLE